MLAKQWYQYPARPRQYVDCQSLPGCRVSRRPSGKRKNKHGLRSWQYGDAPCPRAYCGCRGTAANHRGTAANHRGNIRRPISRASSPRTARYQELRRNARYKELATAKKSGYGTNCKYHRCAANDPCYAGPCYAHHDPNVGKTAKPEIKRSVGCPVREIYYEREDEDEAEDKDDGTMDQGEEPRNLDEFPEQDCDPTCTDCSDITGVALEKTPHIRGGTSDTGLRSLTLKTVACNTDGPSCYYHPEVHQASTLEPFHKPAFPIPREKSLVPTRLPRVALLRPPRPASLQILTQKEREMIRYALQNKQFPTPRPIIREVFRCDHEDLPRPENSHDTPSQMTSEVPPHSQFSQTSTPLSLISRRETPRKEPTPRTWLPGNKLSPRLVTPPLVKTAPKSQTPRELPSQPQSTPPRQQALPTLKSPDLTSPESTPTPPKLPPPQLQRTITPPTPTRQPTPIPTTPPAPFSTLTSDYDSDVTATTTSHATTTNTKSSSRTPTSVCLCRLCGKSRNAATATAAVYKNSNNPLYDIVSPMQSPSRMVTMENHGGGPSRAWAWFPTLCEVVIWLVLAGLFTVKLMPFVESVFRAHVAGSCGVNAVGHGPHLTADGLKSGIENWVTCPVDAARMSGRS